MAGQGQGQESAGGGEGSKLAAWEAWVGTGEMPEIREVRGCGPDMGPGQS